MPTLLLMLLQLPADPLVVVHDGASSDAARAAGAHLQSAVSEAPIDASCARSAACPERPSANALLVVSSSAGRVTLELVDGSGAIVSTEVVEVTDPQLMVAALAPALERIKVAAARPTLPSPTPPAEEGGGAMPWILGTAGVCAGVCALSVGGLIAYAMWVSAVEAGESASRSCNDSLTSACTAPFDALGAGCSGLGDTCSSGSDSLTGACDGLGNIGSCAVAPLMLERAWAPLPPDEGRPSEPTGEMRY